MTRGDAALGMVLSLAVVANLICLGPMSALLDLSSGEGTVSDETTQEAIAEANQIAEEGTVLLKNDGLLPLKNTRNFNLFGWTSDNTDARNRTEIQAGFSLLYPPDEVLVFGDGCNDQSLFRAFPHTRAMGNGDKALQALAERVIESHAQDGVAREIDRLLSASQAGA